MFYQLPPAGQVMRCDGTAQATDNAALFPPWQARYFQSGTAALAAAVGAAVALRGVANPEVLLPAYGCPDLVSAVLHAGATPVPVDFEHGRPWLDLQQLAVRSGPRTVAIIAAHLCGIGERMPALREVATSASALLIEDSAQAFPHGDGGDFWSGDLVVLSFGRGKPCTLLGGGAVLGRDDALLARLPAVLPAGTATPRQRLALRLFGQLYNRLSAPGLYWLPARLPFLHLGETRFRRLDGVRAMDPARLELLACNVGMCRGRGLQVQGAVGTLVGALAQHDSGLQDLPVQCGMPPARALLRYPLLVDPARRAQIVQCAARRGLGLSTLYGDVLPALPGLERLGTAAAFPAARDFAARLLTLPVHDRVRPADIRAMAQCLSG